MDRAGARRAVREATLAGVVVGVVVLCAAVLGLAILAPWAGALGDNLDSACTGESPRVVVDDMIAGGHEGSGATATRSWLPYGPRCTWRLSDGSTVTRDPSWDTTFAALGAAGIAGGALALLARSARHSASRESA